MIKKILILSIFLLLFISACTTEPTVVEETADTTTDNVMERYANFEATIGCDLAEAGANNDSNAVLEIITNAETYAIDEGFTLEELTPLTQQYQKDEEFIALAQEKMFELCGDTLIRLQTQ